MLDTRVTVELRSEENEVVDEVIAALEGEPSLFRRDGRLVRIKTEDPPAGSIARSSWGTTIEPIPNASLRELITKQVRLITENEKGVMDRHPPDWLVSAVAARGAWPKIRYLVGVVNEPVLLSSGAVLQKPGYDETSGLLYVPRDERLAVPEYPSLEDARYAAEGLLELACDFPFAQPEHSAGFLAAVLTPFARFSFIGPAPLFVIDANTPGTGKSLLADVIGVISSGKRMPRTAHVRSDEEVRKQITSVALSGQRLCLIDNVEGLLGSPALDAALTSTTWQDRRLGQSQMTGELALLATFFATGNNVVLNGDTHRRTLHIRLETKRERPEERHDFAHRELLRHVENHRYAYARDALTILRAYHCAGQPALEMTPWGSYEEWSRRVRAPLLWLGLPDPYLTRVGASSAADHEAELLRKVFAAFAILDANGTGMETAELLRRLKSGRYEELRLTFAEWVGRTEYDGSPVIRSLAMKLSHVRDRIIGGRALERRGDRWFLVDTAAEGTTGSTGSRSGRSGSPEPRPAD
ncbi:MAG: hypothetical protein OEZ06_26805 [Myxococcales bacterium]|nr:hypothetical protein [Myxococcales bacterium]